MLTGKQFSTPAKARGNLVRDQQYTMGIAEASYGPQIFRVIKPHAASALHDRLQDNRRNLVGMLIQQVPERVNVRIEPLAAEPDGGTVREVVPRDNVIEEVMHARHRVAERHRAERIPVVASAQCDKLLTARRALSGLVLNRHFDGDLDGHRARVAKKHHAEADRCNRQQAFRELDSRFVCQPPEHHVGRRGQLLHYRLVQDRMIVSMDCAPPRRHPVNEGCAIGKVKRDAVCGNHRQLR